MLPWIAFISKKFGGRTLSDIEFLSIKEFGGKLRQDDGDRNTTGDLVTFTAAGGKDMYMASAKVSFLGSLTAAESATISLVVNGVTKEIIAFMASGSGTGGANGMVTDSYEFRNIGQKVAATQIIKLEVIAISGANIRGVLQVFEENTGESPQIPTI